MMLVFIFATLLCILAVFIINFKTMDDWCFYFISSILLILLWLTMGGRVPLMESFQGNPQPSSSQPAPASGEKASGSSGATLDLDLFNIKLFSLPKDIGKVLLPELDYMIDSVTQEEATKGGDDGEDTVVDEMDYIQSKDPDVTKPNGKGGVDIDKEKMEALRENYYNIDEMLRLLKRVDCQLYNKLLNGELVIGKGVTEEVGQESIETKPSRS